MVQVTPEYARIVELAEIHANMLCEDHANEGEILADPMYPITGHDMAWRVEYNMRANDIPVTRHNVAVYTHALRVWWGVIRTDFVKAYNKKYATYLETECEACYWATREAGTDCACQQHKYDPKSWFDPYY